MARSANIVKFTVKPAQRQRLLAEIQALAAHAQDEDGTLLYVAHTSVEDENELWMYELFSDQEAVEAHESSAVHHRAVQVLFECLEMDPEVHVLDVAVAGKGVLDH
jgi:quinol monooxygenase YgiN